MGDIMEDIYRRREDSQKLNGTSWARQVVNYLWTFFEMSWKGRNDKKFQLENGKREKDQIKNLIEDLKVRTRFIPEKFRKFVQRGKTLLTAKKNDIGKMRRWIKLMTDQRTVADIRKTHHDKYGKDISEYLTSTNREIQSANQNHPITTSESDSLNKNSTIPRLPTV